MTPIERSRGWSRGHTGWAAGTVLLFVLGAVFGLILGNIWLGLVLAAAISIGWLMAYESWKGRNVGLNDPDDDGARL